MRNLFCLMILFAAMLLAGCGTVDKTGADKATGQTQPPPKTETMTDVFSAENTVDMIPTPVPKETEGQTEKTEGQTEKTESVFQTDNAVRITFYGYYGGGKGSDVPVDNMVEIINWLSSFSLGEKAPEILPPGTNTYYVEIEYSDGTVVKNGLDTIVIAGVAYQLESDQKPLCYKEIISKIDLE